MSAKAAGDRLTLALVQHSPVLGDLKANVEWCCEQLAEEARVGSDLIIFPELSLSGYLLKDLVPAAAVRLDGPELSSLISAVGSATAMVGAVLESDDFRFYNAAIVVGQGRVLQVHRKVYLPTYGMFDEQRHLAAGHSFQTVALPLGEGRAWRVGICICEDLWHPSSAYLLSLQAADLIVCPSASPAHGVSDPGGELGSAASYSAMLRTYAELFTVFVAYCNRVGFEDGFHFWGGSRVVAPDGKLCAGPADDRAGTLRVEIDRRQLRRARIAYPLLRDERVDLVQRQLGARDQG